MRKGKRKKGKRKRKGTKRTKIKEGKGNAWNEIIRGNQDKRKKEERK